MFNTRRQLYRYGGQRTAVSRSMMISLFLSTSCRAISYTPGLRDFKNTCNCPKNLDASLSGRVWGSP